MKKQKTVEKSNEIKSCFFDKISKEISSQGGQDKNPQIAISQ